MLRQPARHRTLTRHRSAQAKMHVQWYIPQYKVQCTCILLYTQEWCINGGLRRRVARKKSPGAPETQNFPFWPHFIWGGSLLRPNLPTYTLTHPTAFRNCKKIEQKLIRSFECNLLGGYSTVLKRKKSHFSNEVFLPPWLVHSTPPIDVALIY